MVTLLDILPTNLYVERADTVLEPFQTFLTLGPDYQEVNYGSPPAE